MYTGFCWGDVRERDHLEDPGIVGRKILKLICSKWDRDMDWIGLTHDMLVLWILLVFMVLLC